MFSSDDLDLLRDALAVLDEGFSALPDLEKAVRVDEQTARIQAVLTQTARRLRDNFPYPHPLYAGQMLKPPDPVARLAYMLAMYLNPNNHALDGGRASSAMEKEAVAEIARMFGLPQHLGHLCASGTIANLEALWVAGSIHPDAAVLASSQAHYTHARMCKLLKLPFNSIPVDSTGGMDPDVLETALKQGKVGTVVATLGTTAWGAIDPLPEILELREKYGFRLHIDAAYGGYYKLVSLLPAAARRAYALTHLADSIVIDPHKHGLQPYGCGCVLFADPAVGRLYKHDSPYTYFTSDELHLGEISLECSRPGAAAVALWATMKMLPLVPDGEFAGRLAASHRAALRLHQHLAAGERFLAGPTPMLDIVVWAVSAARREAASIKAQQVFTRSAQQNLHLALVRIPDELAMSWWPSIAGDTALTCLRSCLMKPEHDDWLDRIASIIDNACNHVSGA